jgi:hypothetical protein
VIEVRRGTRNVRKGLLICHWPRWGGKWDPDKSVVSVGSEESNWGTPKWNAMKQYKILFTSLFFVSFLISALYLSKFLSLISPFYKLSSCFLGRMAIEELNIKL